MGEWLEWRLMEPIVGRASGAGNGREPQNHDGGGAAALATRELRMPTQAAHRFGVQVLVGLVNGLRLCGHHRGVADWGLGNVPGLGVVIGLGEVLQISWRGRARRILVPLVPIGRAAPAVLVGLIIR